MSKSDTTDLPAYNVTFVSAPPMPHPLELITMLETEIKMLREENVRLNRLLFQYRFGDRS